MDQAGRADRAAWEGEVFRLLAENVLDYAAFIVDPQRRVLSWSKGAQRLLGFTEAEIVGQKCDVFFTPEDVRQGVPQKELDEALATGRGGEDRWNVRKDGSQFWSSGMVTPLRGDGGALRGFARIVRDRTDLKRGQDAAADALAYAEAIVATVREPLVVLDGDLRVRTANRSFYAAFRVRPGDTEGRLLYDLGDGQWDIPALRTLLGEVLPRDAAFNDFEVEHDFPGIGRKVMLVNARKLWREGNHTELILLAIQDVTALRNAERARREVEARFTEMVKNVRDHSIFLTDPAGVITSWNVSAERIIGYTEAEAVGRHFSLIFTPEDIVAGVPDEELRQAVEEGRAEDERWHRRKDGSLFWAFGVVTPLRDPDGRLSGCSKILRDMTAWKRSEEALRARTEELRATTQQLWRAARLAGVGELAASISHELNNPLATVGLRVEGLLGKTPPDDPRHRPLEVIDQEVRRMADLVGSLLGFCRAGRDQVSTVDLREEAARALELIDHHLSSHGVRVETEFAPDAPAVSADRQQVRQVLLNLLTNAADAMPQGGRLAVRVRAGELGGRPAAAVEVADTGTGVPPEDLPRIFDPFFTTKEEGKGTGLGLAICKRIVDEHKGVIGVESTVGVGTTFRVTLPVRTAADPGGSHSG